MRILRPAVAVATLACLAGGVTASAATKPKPVCNLITDASGDAYATTAAPVGSNEPGIDITSADIASKGKNITAVIRVANLGAAVKTAPTGVHAVLTFVSPGSEDPLYFQYFSGNPLLKSAFDVGYDDPTNGLTSLGDVSGVIDTAKNEIRISAPLSTFAAHSVLKAGQKLTDLSAQTSRDLLVLLPYSDKADSSKTYALDTPSCVKV